MDSSYLYRTVTNDKHMLEPANIGRNINCKKYLIRSNKK